MHSFRETRERRCGERFVVTFCAHRLYRRVAAVARVFSAGIRAAEAQTAQTDT